MLTYGVIFLIIGIIMNVKSKKRLEVAEAEQDAELKEALITTANKSLTWSKVCMVLGGLFTAAGIIFLAMM